MMIDFVFGKKTNVMAIEHLVDTLSELDCDGTLYVGYPIFDAGNDSILTDALLITDKYGVIIFDLSTISETNLNIIKDYQDELYRGVMQKFLSSKELIYRRKLAFELELFSVRNNDDLLRDDSLIAFSDLVLTLQELDPVSHDIFKRVNAVIQKTDVLKPAKKRVKVTSDTSYGGIMKNIEKEIANLDSWQKKAAIESPDKPQRIRGLAGSGKTIILAMKAAYLHAYENDKKIVITFQTRTLYQQIKRLVEKFYFDHKKDEPDYDLLSIQHAWGGAEIGVYSEICQSLGIRPANFTEAKNIYGMDDAFKGVCEDLLRLIGNNEVEPIYDYVLVDEAQDFPDAFFKLIYKFVKDPKRIVWAYDELQNLGDYTMQSPEVLFGKNPQGRGLVSLENKDKKPQQDVMLPICYRNPPWTLTLALSLGLGIYRSAGLIRMFRTPSFWENIGFEIRNGELNLGASVSLQRARERTPDFFYDYIDSDNAIVFETFNNSEEQAKWVAEQIYNDINSRELDASDILVIYPVPYTMQKLSAHLTYELRKLKIDSHVIGKDVSRDIVFKENSIALTHIHRAKGNEAAMVYVMNSNYYFEGFELGRKRNSLFTAITRAKAWVRICGVGDNMKNLTAEYESLRDNGFVLDFEYPTELEMEKLESAYGDKSEKQKDEMKKSFEEIKKIKKMLMSGELSIDDIPSDLKDIFE